MFQDLVGRRFGILTVKEMNNDFSFFEGNGWVCHCDCGTITTFSGNGLVGKVTTDCGCITSNSSKFCNKQDVSDTQDEVEPTYSNPGDFERKVWEDILSVCYNKSDKKYSNFGNRGITVCDWWKDSFENFYNDMGPSPDHKHKVVRKHMSKIYEPGSCKWKPIYSEPGSYKVKPSYEYNGRQLTLLELAETPEAKAKNLIYTDLYSRIVRCGWTVERAFNTKMGSLERKSTCFVTHNGVTKSIREWATEYKIPYHTLYGRLMQYGWSFEKATTVSIKTETTFTHNGITKKVSEWAKEYNKNYTRLYNRLMCYGWSFERAMATP
jgi:hypothetical protein